MPFQHAPGPCLVLRDRARVFLCGSRASACGARTYRRPPGRLARSHSADTPSDVATLRALRPRLPSPPQPAHPRAMGPTRDEIAAYAAAVVDEAPEPSPELVDAVRGVIHPRAPRPVPREPDGKPSP